MSFRGKTAIVGIGETAHKRSWPNRSALGLAAEAAAEAINDAGLRREDIDGLISISTSFLPQRVAEYLGIRPTGFAAGVGHERRHPRCRDNDRRRAPGRRRLQLHPLRQRQRPRPGESGLVYERARGSPRKSTVPTS